MPSDGSPTCQGGPSQKGPCAVTRSLDQAAGQLVHHVPARDFRTRFGAAGAVALEAEAAKGRRGVSKGPGEMRARKGRPTMGHESMPEILASYRPSPSLERRGVPDEDDGGG